jgi:hypothetical protein
VPPLNLPRCREGYPRAAISSVWPVVRSGIGLEKGRWPLPTRSVFTTKFARSLWRLTLWQHCQSRTSSDKSGRLFPRFRPESDKGHDAYHPELLQWECSPLISRSPIPEYYIYTSGTIHGDSREKEIPPHTIPLDISALRRFPRRARRNRTGHTNRA